MGFIGDWCCLRRCIHRPKEIKLNSDLYEYQNRINLARKQLKNYFWALLLYERLPLPPPYNKKIFRQINLFYIIYSIPCVYSTIYIGVSSYSICCTKNIVNSPIGLYSMPKVKRKNINFTADIVDLTGYLWQYFLNMENFGHTQAPICLNCIKY